MNRGPDHGWKTVLFTAEALTATAVAAGVALVAALALGIL